MAKRSDEVAAAGPAAAGAVRVRPAGLCWPIARKRYQYQRSGRRPSGSACTLWAVSGSARSVPRATTVLKASSSASSHCTDTAFGSASPISRVHSTTRSARGLPEATPSANSGAPETLAASAWRSRAGAQPAARAAWSRPRREGVQRQVMTPESSREI